MTAFSTVRRRIRPTAGLRARLAPTLAGVALFALAACGSGGKDKQATPPPAQVGYVTVSESSVPMVTELPAPDWALLAIEPSLSISAWP